MDILFHVEPESEKQHGPNVKPFAGRDASGFYVGFIFEDEPLTIEFHGKKEDLQVLARTLNDMALDLDKMT